MTPVLTIDQADTIRNDCSTIGANSNAISERKTTPVKVRSAIAVQTLEGGGFLAFGARLRRKYNATLTGNRIEKVNSNEVLSDIPGNRANIFGRVRPIQKPRWNWVQVRRTHSNPVKRPKRLETARRRRLRPKAFMVAKTSRTGC